MTGPAIEPTHGAVPWRRSVVVDAKTGWGSSDRHLPLVITSQEDSHFEANTQVLFSHIDDINIQ